MVLEQRWSRKLDTICFISRPDILLATKNVRYLHTDKFNIMAQSTKLLRKEVTPPKSMNVDRG